jgi:lysophospholipid acyltransferase (LPLAT)-like uncharacterized protein
MMNVQAANESPILEMLQLVNLNSIQKQKINGEVINIARISQAGIIATSYSTSRFKRLNTWDKFFIPLPFSTICFYFDENPIYVAKNSSEEEIAKIKITVEDRANLIQEKSQILANLGN